MPEGLVNFAVLYGILTTIIFIHECGHYVAGRWVGMRATKVVTGVGPKLWGFSDSSGTMWELRLFMLGGYCRFDDEEQENARPQHRLVMVLGGPLANYAMVYLILLMAILVAFLAGAPNELALERMEFDSIGEMLWMPIQVSFQLVWGFLYDVLSGALFVQLFESGNLVGVVGMMGDQQDRPLIVVAFLMFFALNLGIGALNLLTPLLPLDGGHVVLELLRLARMKERGLETYKTINFGAGLVLVLVLLASTVLADVWVVVRGFFN